MVAPAELVRPNPFHQEVKRQPAENLRFKKPS